MSDPQLHVIRVDYDGSLCGSCVYCCHVLQVDFVPAPVSFVPTTKPAHSACWHLLSVPDRRGCGLHGKPGFPRACRNYTCPHILAEHPEWRGALWWPDGSPFTHRIYRPDEVALHVLDHVRLRPLPSRPVPDAECRPLDCSILNTYPACPVVPVTGRPDGRRVKPWEKMPGDLEWAEDLVRKTGAITATERQTAGGMTVGYVIGIADLTGARRDRDGLGDAWQQWMEMFGRRRA